jgi:DNA-binding GntR family transcriptional regulator
MDEIVREIHSASLADRAYRDLKAKLFDFHYLPGDRLSENDLAHELDVSRTPLRQALQRLQHEGLIEAVPRMGWIVPQLNFEKLDELYDFRVMLECYAARELCQREGDRPAMDALFTVWHAPVTDRHRDPILVGELDEAFHSGLVAATGNAEMARVHREISDRIRIVRRLDFTKTDRITATYEEHAKILTALRKRRADEAQRLLGAHIEASKLEVRKITIDMLYQARGLRAKKAREAGV